MPAEPELKLGTDALFTTLAPLRATYSLQVDREGCDELAKFDTTIPTDGCEDGSPPPCDNYDVSVVQEAVVGPYESVVLRGESPGAVIGWLQDHNYDVPDVLEGALAPYVAPETHFVALRLRKGRDTGDLEPLALTWKGTGMTIPIRLTSVAATPDMRLRVYVLGEHRAVPESYLHVQPNPLAINWWTRGGNLTT